MMPKRTTKRLLRSGVPLDPNINTANMSVADNKGLSARSGQVLKMKYTYEVSQWNTYTQSYMVIFCDLDAEAFEQHSTTARWWLTHHHAPVSHISPARSFIGLHFNVFLGDPFLHPNALKYVLCAINRARRGKKIFLELPKDFILSVQVYQVLIFLQVEECIAPMHGYIRQFIRERPLSPVEFDALWSCLGVFAPRIYDFALSMYYEHQKHKWSLGPVVEDPEPSGDMEEDDTEEGVSPREETVIGLDEVEDTRMTLANDSDTELDDTGYVAEDEADEEFTAIINQPTTSIYSRRRSVPTPYSQPIYEIDTSEFHECADEQPEY
jgi:hypothetical protein